MCAPKATCQVEFAPCRFRLAEGRTAPPGKKENRSAFTSALGKGLYRDYITKSDCLPFLCGRPDIQAKLRRPWEVKFDCHFQDHTPDLEDNRILAWTLLRIARTSLCTELSARAVHHARRRLQGAVAVRSFKPKDCLKRLYHRLNEDYEVLHALCRFFLENSGPTNASGDHTFFPFLIDMARLFEGFVAGWLRQTLPYNFVLRVQARFVVNEHQRLHYIIDLVICDSATQKPLCILDTKYKATTPTMTDVEQVVAYSVGQNCNKALLVYPAGISTPLARLGEINVQSAVFDITRDLTTGGQAFLEGLLKFISH